MSHSCYQGGDPAGYPQASCGFDFDAVDENIARHDRELRRRTGAGVPIEVVMAISEPMRTSDALLKYIVWLIEGTNIRLRVDVSIAAIGFPIYEGISYTEMARRHGISKQAFDKQVLKFQKDFQLPVTRAQKSPKARASYQKTQLARQEHLEQLRKNQKERTELVWQNSSGKAPRVP